MAESMTAPNYAILENRAVLSVSGQDAVEFLQGLVSNDVERVNETTAIWAAFLTPQGKFLHEFMIAHRDGKLLLDCEASRAVDLQTRLKRFRLRAKVDVALEEALGVAAIWGDQSLALFGLDGKPGAATRTDDGVALCDPRLSAAGARIIAERKTLSQSLETLGCVAKNATDYDLHRVSLGLPDGSRDMEVEKALLLENGFEELGGVDFKKGCYIGQELTARTHYRALIKKRLLPVDIDGEAPPAGTPLTLDGKDAGEMKSSAGQRGLALIRLATWRSAADGFLSAGSTTVKPVPSVWMALPESGASK